MPEVTRLTLATRRQINVEPPRRQSSLVVKARRMGFEDQFDRHTITQLRTAGASLTLFTLFYHHHRTDPRRHAQRRGHPRDPREAILDRSGYHHADDGHGEQRRETRHGVVDS